ncbi:MAG: redox-regulated ATPase YchF [Chloroflexi bacterium]|nr:redox-regulated ATPase YchF [Chloroflexota bacterium]MCY4248778.1 redox-regulated ATPase YchF [Chloroflexota bacterium]
MRLAIIGLPNSGKTTIFNALTGGDYQTSAASSGQFALNSATVRVPDERVDQLSQVYQPRKSAYAQITYADVAGLDKGIGEGGLAGQFRSELAQADGFLHILRCFDDARVPHPYQRIDPARDLEVIDSEFLLLDLLATEARLGRIESELRLKGSRADKSLLVEAPLFKKLQAHLEAEQPLRSLPLDAAEEKLIRGFGFLTRKPTLALLNQGDEAKAETPAVQLPYPRAALAVIQGALEAELAQLDAADAALFMAEYGLGELSRSKVIRLSYQLLGIQSFFTVGADEVRAWSFPAGANAKQAAGLIHSDFEHGFIRAEVFRYADLLELGSESAIKAAGRQRLEGKDYLVQDGDIMNIRHSS